MCLYVLFFVIVCLRVCWSVCMCASLCDSKNIIFGGACWLYHILCPCPTHQGSYWYACFLSLPLSLLLFPSLLPHLFSIYLSIPLFLLPIWHFCCPQTASLHFPHDVTYWILSGEPFLFPIANWSSNTCENSSSSKRNFKFHIIQMLSIVNKINK